MSVTTVDVLKYLASGSKDYSTRVWDLETQQAISVHKIERNIPSAIKWHCQNTYIQTSEDLHMRLYDIRDFRKPQA